MAYRYPTEIDAQEGFLNVLDYLNEVTGGMFFTMFLIAIFGIIFFGYTSAQRNDYLGGFAVSTFSTFAVALLLFISGLISGFTFAIVIGFTLLSVIILLTLKE